MALVLSVPGLLFYPLATVLSRGIQNKHITQHTHCTTHHTHTNIIHTYGHTVAHLSINTPLQVFINDEKCSVSWYLTLTIILFVFWTRHVTISFIRTQVCGHLIAGHSGPDTWHSSTRTEVRPAPAWYELPRVRGHVRALWLALSLSLIQEIYIKYSWKYAKV